MRQPEQNRFQTEAETNLARWHRKPLLQKIYARFHRLIAGQIRREVHGPIVEIGSGIGNLKTVMPECLSTDQFARPGIDRVEDAYSLSFKTESVSHVILFDVWHHLQFPGSALREFHRVLAPGGRVIIFDPAISWLGWLVYGAFHSEPVGWREEITWLRNNGEAGSPYYSAQGNATRIFCTRNYEAQLAGWRRVTTQRLAAISYVASGGYRGPQLYPAAWLPLMTAVDRLCDCLPACFATRLLVVLEKE